MSYSRTTSPISFLSPMSPGMNGPHLTAHLCPALRSSRVTGSKPDCDKRFAVWLPIYPAPPVNKIFVIFDATKFLNLLHASSARSVVSIIPRQRRRTVLGFRTQPPHVLWFLWY